VSYERLVTLLDIIRYLVHLFAAVAAILDIITYNEAHNAPFRLLTLDLRRHLTESPMSISTPYYVNMDLVLGSTHDYKGYM
jgi:hypothetical protein